MHRNTQHLHTDISDKYFQQTGKHMHILKKKKIGALLCQNVPTSSCSFFSNTSSQKRAPGKYCYT